MNQDQHYVQKARLKNFVTEKSGHFFRGDIKTKEIRNATPRKSCIDSKRWSLSRETSNAKIESLFPEKLNEIRRFICDKSYWSRYMQSEMMNDLRSLIFMDDFAKEQREKMYDFIESNIHLIGSEEDFSESVNLVDSTIRGEEMTSSQLKACRLVMYMKPWSIHYSKVPSFVIPDGIFMRSAQENTRSTFFPLASDICIQINPISAHMIPNFYDIMTYDELICNKGPVVYRNHGKNADLSLINKRIASQAYEFIFGNSRELIRQTLDLL